MLYKKLALAVNTGGGHAGYTVHFPVSHFAPQACI